METAPVENDDRPARSAAGGFGVDSEERVTPGVEVYRLAVQNRVGDLRFQATLAFEVLRGCDRRGRRETGKHSGEEKGRTASRRTAQAKRHPDRPGDGAQSPRPAIVT